MRFYFNPSNYGFAEALRSEIYVDKSSIIAYANKVLGTKQKYICISRPRRFGKTMAAEMLTAYYSRGCDSNCLFENLMIAAEPSYKSHLNRYNLIFMNIQRFLSDSHEIKKMIADINEKINKDILEVYPDLCNSISKDNLMSTLEALFKHTEIPIVFIIDEWDCMFRERQNDKETQKIYLDFLRNLLKDREYVALAYMTGILPIKKYGSHSALNMFSEYSMTDPEQLAEYVGFSQSEVFSLCDRYDMKYELMAQWYDGYSFPDLKSVYNPNSVTEALLKRRFKNYWGKTETFEALSVYIKINYCGLKDTIIELLAGIRKRINIDNFTNDMVSFKTYEDVLTLLIHLGYLGYDIETQEVFVPNKEISDEFVTAIRDAGWDEIITALEASDDLLNATWRGDSHEVARSIERAHNETSIIRYNDENALSCVISLAYYNARQYYNIVREMPAGKGFADLVFLPRKNYMNKPAMIIELKWNNPAAGAIRQIEDRQYPEALKDYRSNALLVGISYDKDSKRHECMIKVIN